MTIYPPLKIPETLAAGPGPGNTDPRVLERFAKTGVADHMQKDVLRGMIEAKAMLRELWGTKNRYTYGVGHGLQRVDCVLSTILPGDTVVVFPNGTFSGIGGLTIRMKASSNEELAANSFNPKPKNVVTMETPHGKSVIGEFVDKALAEHTPMWAFMARGVGVAVENGCPAQGKDSCETGQLRRGNWLLTSPLAHGLSQ